ncbi:MAG: amidase [Gammaproteobacteria bacterium]|jgi:amidase
MTDDDFAAHDAIALAELVRSREVQPVELLETAIARIERLNPRLNAVVTRLYDQARAAVAREIPDGPFPGVPFLLKDLGTAYAGAPMTSGSRLFRTFVPEYDSELVRRLKKAGLIIVGKTNTPEFGILPTTESDLFGPARNPWDSSKTTGGSSGGSAAAVAAGLVPMAQGGDGGGSIRIPASCCGVFGLKPTRARTPLGPDAGDIMSGLVVAHALTRSVRDSAALLDATAGPDLGDPYYAPPQARPFLQEAGTEPGRLRIGYTTRTFAGDEVHLDCVEAVHDAAKLCSALGHQVEEASPVIDSEKLRNAFTVLWAAGCAGFLEAYSQRTSRPVDLEQIEPLTRALYEMGRSFSAADYLVAVRWLQGFSRQIAHFFQDIDVWLTPTLAEPPVSLGTFESTPDDPLAGFYRSFDFVPFTPVCNVTGQPAMSVPLYWNAEGLPVGVHFAGRYGDEATLFRLAAQLETARPWIGRKPPL